MGKFWGFSTESCVGVTFAVKKEQILGHTQPEENTRTHASQLFDYLVNIVRIAIPKLFPR